MTAITNDQGNYAADRAAARLSPATVERAKSIAVGHQDIDPNCSGETAGYHGWLHRVKRQSSEATVADILALEGRYQEVVQHVATEEGNHDTTKRLLVDSETQRDYYRDQFDITRRSLTDWQSEAARAQREVISQAETILNLRAVILAVAACDQSSGFENPLLEVPAELYQRLMRVAAELGVK